MRKPKYASINLGDSVVQDSNHNDAQFWREWTPSEEFIKGHREGCRIGFRDGIRAAIEAVNSLNVEEVDIPAPTVPVQSAVEDDIRFLELSNRTLNALHRGHIMSISELGRRNAQELLDLRGIGPLAIDEIKAKLAERGYTLAEY